MANIQSPWDPSVRVWEEFTEEEALLPTPFTREEEAELPLELASEKEKLGLTDSMMPLMLRNCSDRSAVTRWFPLMEREVRSPSTSSPDRGKSREWLRSALSRDVPL